MTNQKPCGKDSWEEFKNQDAMQAVEGSEPWRLQQWLQKSMTKLYKELQIYQVRNIQRNTKIALYYVDIQDM